jgi:phospholipid/cholesterol/gamma-HCH transport system ATP-binding protein
MIKIKDIHKSFGQEEILKGIALQIPTESRTCIIGPSGTGKSVLLKIILGLEQSDRGEVIFDGVSTKSFQQRDWDHFMQDIGLVFQGAALFDSLRVWENVGLRFLETGKMKKTDIRDQVASSLTRVHLSPDIMDKYPAALSGGMQKRVGIARAIIHQPRYLFFDEPTTGLDPMSAEAIDSLIYEISQQEGQTSVVVTHDLLSVRKLATQVVMLMGGTVVFDGNVVDFWAEEQEAVKSFLKRGPEMRE